MKQIRLRINQEDIDNGVQKHGCRCPIALAMKRRFGPQNIVTVGLCTTGIDGDTLGNFINLASAMNFVRQFDLDKSKCKPCWVYLEEFHD
jgi:hypothetical protein